MAGCGEDGNLSDVLEHAIDGHLGYEWVRSIARDKPYTVFDLANNVAFGGTQEEQHIAGHLRNWLGGAHCPPSIRGRLAGRALRFLHQYLDDPMMFSGHVLETPRQSQKNYVNRLVKGRLSDGMLRVGAKKTREIFWVLGAMANHMTDAQTKRWARRPLIRQLDTIFQGETTPMAGVRARLAARSLMKSAKTARTPSKRSLPRL